jgi:serine/threonine-protein kinase RsbW
MQADTARGAILSFTPPDHAHLLLPGTALGVRHALRDFMACALVQDCSSEALGTAELVVAEALNNVVEHAYATYPGVIEVDIRRTCDQLFVLISDMGLPMPGAEPPLGKAPEFGAFDDLPEGGFGWFLIRRLVEDLTYRREGERNFLSFCVKLDNVA